LGARVHLHLAEADLPLQRLIRTQEQLLPGLPARIERTRHLRAAEGAIRQRAAVFARERHTLRDTLIDDVHADLREAVHVGLARAEITAFDGVVEQAPDGIAVVGIIFRRVDATLRGDRVRAPRRILEAEALDVVAQLGE